mgnify:CR=1 FL=1
MKQQAYLRMGGLVAVACLLIGGVYALGAAQGAEEAAEQLMPRVRELTIESNTLRQELTELELNGVKECSLRAVDAVLDCEQVCAQEVSSALEGCTLLLCGEVRGGAQ